MNNDCTAPRLSELLHAYELDLLDEREKEEFEIHLLDCPSCLDRVIKFQQPADLLKNDPEVTQIIQESLAKFQPKQSALSRVLKYLLEIMEQKKPDFGPINVLRLFPSSTEIPEVAKGENGLLIAFAFSGADLESNYRISIKSEQMESIYQKRYFSGFDQYGTGRIIIPSDKLTPGLYTLVVEDATKKQLFKKHEYSFRIIEEPHQSDPKQ
jgi:hypothetical protein